jgi:hypothetical protein
MLINIPKQESSIFIQLKDVCKTCSGEKEIVFWTDYISTLNSPKTRKLICPECHGIGYSKINKFLPVKKSYVENFYLRWIPKIKPCATCMDRCYQGIRECRL